MLVFAIDFSSDVLDACLVEGGRTLASAREPRQSGHELWQLEQVMRSARLSWAALDAIATGNPTPLPRPDWAEAAVESLIGRFALPLIEVPSIEAVGSFELAAAAAGRVSAVVLSAGALVLRARFVSDVLDVGTAPAAVRPAEAETWLRQMSPKVVVSDVELALPPGASRVAPQPARAPAVAAFALAKTALVWKAHGRVESVRLVVG